MSSTNPEFGKIRSYLWPIHNYELKKVLPMFVMFFLISANYTLLRNAKDTLLLYAPHSGSEVIQYLKFWGVVPFAFIFMFIYNKLSNSLKKEALFYASVVPFIVFFLLFRFVLAPNVESLHFAAAPTLLNFAQYIIDVLNTYASPGVTVGLIYTLKVGILALCVYLAKKTYQGLNFLEFAKFAKVFMVIVSALIAYYVLPFAVAMPSVDFLTDGVQEVSKGFVNFFTMFGNWTFSLYYIFAELWGSVALSLLFWGFANDITHTKEAKRVYAVMGIGANLALLVVGPLTKYIAVNAHYYIDAIVSSINSYVPALSFYFLGGSQGDISYLYTASMVVDITTISSIVIIMIYRWINVKVLTDPKLYTPEEKTKKKKPKLSMKESFKYLISSKHLRYIAALVFGYGISIILVENVWKGQAKLLFSSQEFTNFMGNINIFMGLSAITLMLFVSGNVLRILGWRVTALITPVALIISVIGFFGFTLYGQYDSSFTLLGYSALAISVFFGAVQNVATKSSKYALFDLTKEMAYIPLDQESKVKGKSAIDVVGARLGKATGTFINQGLLAFVGTSVACAPYAFILLIPILFMWVTSVIGLDKSLKTMEEESK